MHLQACFCVFLKKTYCFFDVLTVVTVVVAKSQC